MTDCHSGWVRKGRADTVRVMRERGEERPLGETAPTRFDEEEL